MKQIFLLLAPVCLLLSSCAGYTLGGQKPAHLRNITKIAVPTFKNLTLEPRLAVLVTNAVIKQLQNHGSYQIVAKSDAEAVLEGNIQQITRSQFRSDRNNILLTSQIMATLNSSYVIKDAASGTVLHNGSASADSYIILDANLQLSETQLLEDAAQRLAYNVADEVSEGW
ncbi:LPS assembly lipoprotein LptE [Prosthecobacter sp.]|uniref:LPS assembly lipoprotein LptE n=1 Tax=Prosthecobacter sp. TaxID=1965333 RepID=UPI002ABABD16|nr:LPS assembly lipoprotein LptE [Prosthecobacter sp.]MDZ4403534.1 LPS assembly lipoprotein LptE [Prosthecobacter sp.]